MMEFADWLAATSLSQFLAGNALAFPLIEIVHVLAISLVLGTVFIFDLRLVGWSWREWPAARLLETLRPFAFVGFAGAVVSGVLLFASQPTTYAVNIPFRIKLVLLVLAGINVLLFHGVFGRLAAQWDRSGRVAPTARLSALLSLILWIGVLLAGRFIGFFLYG